ncbi:thermonuclease family protein [Sphingobacterium hungaricum]|uniref:Nuclease n=1 Tax=Sphingobacterium hungaricum TaxID=2082723 RepID=A0A928YPM8_9SPHI|nr:thermonuclease family protein [Sphingobacterium hungaricum]MBE8712692.1 nuclease [Sphingobacterium hungaricum]
MKLILFSSILIVSLLLTDCQSKSARYAEGSKEIGQGKRSRIANDYYTVFKVIDGDTFWVESHDNKQIKIRLIGIDAPETRNAFKYKKHPFGAISKTYLSDMILEKEIRLIFDVDSLDRFGRTLAYAYLKSGDFVNENLVRNGYATLMTIQPNVKFENHFYNAQVHARENNLGIWQNSISE